MMVSSKMKRLSRVPRERTIGLPPTKSFGSCSVARRFLACRCRKYCHTKVLIVAIVLDAEGGDSHHLNLNRGYEWMQVAEFDHHEKFDSVNLGSNHRNDKPPPALVPS